MKRFLHILFFAFVSVGLSAQTLPSLLVSADGAVAGTGGLAVAARPGAWSLENNAAMLPFQDGRLAAAVSYGMWQPAFANDKVLGAGVSFKASDRLSFGLTARNFAMPEYTVVNELGAESQVNGTFSPRESTLGLGGAFALSDHFSVGVSAKMTSSSLAKDAKAPLPDEALTSIAGGEDVDASKCSPKKDCPKCGSSNTTCTKDEWYIYYWEFHCNDCGHNWSLDLGD